MIIGLSLKLDTSFFRNNSMKEF